MLVKLVMNLLMQRVGSNVSLLFVHVIFYVYMFVTMLMQAFAAKRFAFVCNMQMCGDI